MLHPSLKGKFLIATPELCDPNFAEVVVLICEHNSKGAFGLIINRKSTIRAKANFEAISQYPDHAWITHQDVYIGGPVHTNQVLILYRSENLLSENVIVDDVALATNLTDLPSLNLFENGKEKLHMYLGCSGWSENQLESEIEMGTWKVLSSKTDMIFDMQPARVWKQNLSRLGGKYSILALMPDSENIIRN